jgi:hypothetical protein
MKSPMSCLFPPTGDVIGNYTHALLVAVRARGHDVRVVLPRHMAEAPSESADAANPGVKGGQRLRTTSLHGIRT